jgi:hypothetical protein
LAKPLLSSNLDAVETLMVDIFFDDRRTDGIHVTRCKDVDNGARRAF